MEQGNHRRTVSTADAQDTSVFRRYEIPASNGVTASSLARHDSDASLNRFRSRPVRPVKEPIPARRGNAHTIKGLDEMSLRLGPNTMRPDHSRQVSYRESSESTLGAESDVAPTVFFDAPETSTLR